MTLLDTVNVGETNYGVQSRVPMGTCATPAGSEVKECLFADNFSLSVGNLIAVTFTYANTYGDGSTTYPKLTVNGTQYPVKFPTGEYASSGAWANGQAVTFMFDGTNLLMTTLPVTNEVALNNMYSVSSNAVYSELVDGDSWHYWNTETITGNMWYKIVGKTVFLRINISNNEVSFPDSGGNMIYTASGNTVLLPAKIRPQRNTNFLLCDNFMDSAIHARLQSDGVIRAWSSPVTDVRNVSSWQCDYCYRLD